MGHVCFLFSETAFGNFICMKDTFAWKEEIKKRERWADKNHLGNQSGELFRVPFM